jgi:transposase-like protein
VDGVAGREGDEAVRESVIRRRRRWSDGDKAQIVREVQRPGAVLQEVARRYGLHPSLLTRWRAQQQTVETASKREARLLPVRVEAHTRGSARSERAAGQDENAVKSGSIEIEFSAGRRVHIQGMVDAQTLRTLLQELSQP